MTYLFQYILSSADGWIDLPTILLGIVMACLTILVSVAIAIFSEKKEFEKLDNNVILDHIIKAKNLLLFLGLTFFSLLFWNASPPWTRLLGAICWVAGVVFITKILIRSYQWMKKNKFKLRFDYLSKLRNSEDMEEVWRSVWQTENINTQNEREFFKIFHTTINRLLNNDKPYTLVIAWKLIDDFNNHMDNRSTEFLTLFDEMLNNILQWHFKIWGKEYEYLSENNKLETWSMYNNLSRTIDSIFQNIEIRVLKNRAPFTFFKKLEKHAEQYKTECVSSYFYAESLLDTFYQVYFENIYDSPDRYNIWKHYFPKQWTVTKSNIQGSDSIIPKISLNKFLGWANNRIWKANEEKDLPLNDVSTNLFPEVDTTVWAKVLIFVFTPYSEGDRLRAVIEKPWNFGFVGRVKVYNAFQEDELEQMYQNEETNTVDLSVYLFRKEFSKTNLEDYMKSLEQLSYPKDSVEGGKKLQLLRLFSAMLNFLSNSDLSMKD